MAARPPCCQAASVGCQQRALRSVHPGQGTRACLPMLHVSCPAAAGSTAPCPRVYSSHSSLIRPVWREKLQLYRTLSFSISVPPSIGISPNPSNAFPLLAAQDFITAPTHRHRYGAPPAHPAFCLSPHFPTECTCPTCFLPPGPLLYFSISALPASAARAPRTALRGACKRPETV